MTTKKPALQVKLEKANVQTLYLYAAELKVPLYKAMDVEDLRDLLIECYCPETAHL